MCHDIESFGSGFKRVYVLCKEAHVNCTYEKTPIGFSFIFLRNATNDLKNVPKHDINVPIVLTKTENTVYELLRKQPNLTKEELAMEIAKTTKTVQRTLDGLKEKGLISKGWNKQKGLLESEIILKC